MDAIVTSQTTVLSESLPTYGTFERFDSLMGSHVVVQVIFLFTLVGTLGTFEWLFACMHA